MTERDDQLSARATTELTPSGDTQKLTAPAAESHDWVDAASAAGLAWLAALCVGAICLLAPKLQYPGFARGADPVEIFTGIVVVTLGLMRVPIHIGTITISALPLGALAGIGVAIAWATTSAFGVADRSGREAAAIAVKVALVFATIAPVLALIFRYREGEPVYAGAVAAFIWAFVWAWVFAAAGAWRAPRRWGGRARERLRAIPSTLNEVRAGLWGGALMLATAGALAFAALLLWLIVGLVRGLPYGGFGWGDALAALLYLVAFLPNLIVLVVALSMGAPVVRGAQVGLGGRVIGSLQEVSLLDWPGSAPEYAYGMLLIPVVACLAGGWWIARRIVVRAAVWRAIGVAALTFALTLAVLAWLGEARMGAGLVRDRGFARVSVVAVPTFAWAMLWGTVLGWLGWELGARRKER